MQTINLLLICALLINILVTGPVNSGCTNRNEDAADGEESNSGVSSFLHNVGCSLRSGVKKVKESVESGYKYLKTKVQTTSDDESEAKTADDKKDEVAVVAEVLEDRQFETSSLPSSTVATSTEKDPEINVRIDATQANAEIKNTTEPVGTGRTNIDSDDRITFRDDENANEKNDEDPTIAITPTLNLTLNDRAALNAPNTCDNPGETRDNNGICRSPTRLNVHSK